MNTQLSLAQEFVFNTGTNIFLTGKAGTGKTTFLRNIRVQCPKRMIVVAPTGVAAINAGGVTIHSFFQLPFGPYLPATLGEETSGKININRFSKEKINIMKSLDLLVIDEISMVRADTLDAVSDVLCRFRRNSNPFGGVQLLFIGDIQQLAPVAKDDEWALLKDIYASPYFFDSKAFGKCNYYPIELTHIYRQENPDFINILNKIRESHADRETLQTLNKRYIPNFDPKDDEGYITLTTHNNIAQKINFLKLNDLPGKSFVFSAEIKDDFPEYSYPTDPLLTLKLGAQVMFVKNDSSPEKKYYNGKIGKISRIDNEHIVVTDSDGNAIEVHREIWENVKYSIDKTSKEIQEEIIGSFVQYPLKTAWAITIHKSQGLTFERAIIDAAASFSHGQVYVALSRCKSLEGMVLRSPISERVLINDFRIDEFNKHVETSQPDSAKLRDAQKEYFTKTICELFDFDDIQKNLRYSTNVLYSHLKNIYPATCAQFADSNTNFAENVTEIGRRFQNQLSRMIATSSDFCNDDAIRERVRKGVEYFMEQIGKFCTPLPKSSEIEIDNKETRRLVDTNLNEFHEAVFVKICTLTACRDGFDVVEYLSAKAKAAISDDLPKEKTRKSKSKEKKLVVPADIQNPALFEALRQWRTNVAKEKDVPAFMILSNKVLITVANARPLDKKDLLQLPGIGKRTVELYGDALLEIVMKGEG